MQNEIIGVIGNKGAEGRLNDTDETNDLVTVLVSGEATEVSNSNWQADVIVSVISYDTWCFSYKARVVVS